MSLSQATAEMIEGETVQLIATVLPSDATNKSVIWASSKQSVATVSNTGLVSAIAEGTSTITASVGDKSATCTVTVSKKIIEVSSVKLNKESLELVEGDSETLIATVLPENATDKIVTWESSDPSVARVDQNGTVTAVAEGQAGITAMIGDKGSFCKVVVSKKVIAVESISLNKDELTLEKGKTETLIATVKPDDATDKSVTWNSSDDGIVSVDQVGKISAIKGGEATITASAGDKSAKCKVTVTVPVESITLDLTSITLEEGKTTTIKATVSPNDATDKTVSWSSSNTAVATVADGKITAVKEGSATITAEAGGKSATCSVTVKKQVIAVTSVTLNKTTLTLEKGQSETLVATVLPNGATDKKITWSSSDDSIAKVDQNGKVTAQNGGNATVTAKAGEKSATCSVTVTVPVQSVTLNQSNITLEIGQTFTLTADILPQDATDNTITWTSSNSSVASVNSNGLITALAAGTTAITATVGGKSASCVVSVNQSNIPVTGITLDQTSVTLTEGQSITLIATVSPANATNKTVSWNTSNGSVATVDQNGKVTAVAQGNATITATAGYYSASCAVTVQQNVIAVTSVTLNKTSLPLKVGESETIIATVKPDNATDKTVTWTSSAASVATVDNSGKVSAIAVGTAFITATAGDKNATCEVTVTANNISFADSNVKTICVSNWDTDGDGELSYNEAASVANIGQVFRETQITTFEELQYFTGINAIPSDAFHSCTSLQSIVIPNSVNTIGEQAFSVCVELHTVIIPNTVTSIGDKAFYTCKVLPSITIPNSVKSIGKSAFTFCDSLTSIIIPDSVTEIASGAFSYCQNLASVVLPKYITHIGAFSGCSKLTSINIPDSVTTIDADAFNGCSSLASINIPASVKSIWNNAFKNCGSIGSITIPDSVTQLGNETFMNCTGLTSITVLATTPPYASNGGKCFDNTNDCPINVPGHCLDDYKSAKGWNDYADRIQAITQAYVDLGLSVKWASYNVGATKPEEYGDYFAWGEITPKNNYSWATYKWCKGAYTTLTKYCPSGKTDCWGGSGSPDNKTSFADYGYEDDAARANWGGKWRMPTKAEYQELMNNCDYEWTTFKGVNGYLFTSKNNGNSIFLPATGGRGDYGLSGVGAYGNYWSSSLNTIGDPSYAWVVNFDSGCMSIPRSDRYNGLSVRPVTE